MPDLGPIHEAKRMAFAARMHRNRTDQCPIVFNNESQFIQKPRCPAVWQNERLVSLQFTFTKQGHSIIAVKAWGAISSGGYRSRLLRCPDPINKQSDTRMPVDARICEELNRAFGELGYRFQ
jgi:hypothetical protein